MVTGPFFVRVLWIVAVLLVTTLTANVIGRDRVNQTLEVLLTTPLTGEEILRQKLAGPRLFGGVMACLFGLVFLVEAVAENRALGWPGLASAAVYLTASTLSLRVYLPLVMWLSLAIGLHVPRGRAALVALGIIVAWCVAPYWVLDKATSHAFLYLFSPYGAIDAAENCGHDGLTAAAVFLLNFAAYGGLLYTIRRYCARNADRLLGRVPSP
jgi:ABC-type Na+ efflux pump permease subunit